MEAVEQGLGERRDNLERLMRENTPDWEPPPEVDLVMFPFDYVWEKFLEHKGWTDAAVLGRQTIERVYFNFRFHQLEIKYE